METERLIIDSLKETDRENYFRNISHDRKVLETFICQYAETLEEFDFSGYLSNSGLYAIRLKETEQLIFSPAPYGAKFTGLCRIRRQLRPFLETSVRTSGHARYTKLIL